MPDNKEHDTSPQFMGRLTDKAWAPTGPEQVVTFSTGASSEAEYHEFVQSHWDSITCIEAKGTDVIVTLNGKLWQPGEHE